MGYFLFHTLFALLYIYIKHRLSGYWICFTCQFISIFEGGGSLAHIGILYPLPAKCLRLQIQAPIDRQVVFGFLRIMFSVFDFAYRRSGFHYKSQIFQKCADYGPYVFPREKHLAW